MCKLGTMISWFKYYGYDLFFCRILVMFLACIWVLRNLDATSTWILKHVHTLSRDLVSLCNALKI